jgi:hypothetical protein
LKARKAVVERENMGEMLREVESRGGRVISDVINQMHLTYLYQKNVLSNKY